MEDRILPNELSGDKIVEQLKKVRDTNLARVARTRENGIQRD